MEDKINQSGDVFKTKSGGLDEMCCDCKNKGVSNHETR